MSRGFAVLAAVVVALAACGGEPDPPEASPTATGSTAAASFSPDGCPVQDERFCVRASAAANALVAGDAASLFDLSFSQRFDCDEVETQFFPACESNDRLAGYSVVGADFRIEVLDPGAYRSQLRAVFGAIDPSFSDEHGGGAPQVLGVGTCGPPEPGRRSYHLVWTAAASQGGAEPDRLIGSFEFVLDEEWVIGLWFLDTLDGWGEVYSDPFAEAGCAGGRSPWLG
jgi:hypothetical protein